MATSMPRASSGVEEIRGALLRASRRLAWRDGRLITWPSPSLDTVASYPHLPRPGNEARRCAGVGRASGNTPPCRVARRARRDEPQEVEFERDLELRPPAGTRAS